MRTGRGRRALSLGYLVPFSALAATLILVGSLVERVPLLPPSVGRRYQDVTLAVLSRLARFADGWTDQPPQPVPGGLPDESPP